MTKKDGEQTAHMGYAAIAAIAGGYMAWRALKTKKPGKVRMETTDE
jgi:drug/metabolite transporter superfamily protein YnfA